MNTSVACVPDCAGKRCSSTSCAFWDSMPGTVKSSLNEPPAKTAPADQRDQHGDDGERCGSRAAPDQQRDTGERGGHDRKNTQTQSKIKLS